MKNIQVLDADNGQQNVAIDSIPNLCPKCHHKITPSLHAAFWNPTKRPELPDEELQVQFRCPNMKCRDALIGYYKWGSSNEFQLVVTKPQTMEPRKFSKTLEAISKSFSEIYNQAFEAEQHGLTVICGGGYRKALEFLIKDYLLPGAKDEAAKETIKNENLGQCINNCIQDDHIKAVAARAAWLGNDEVHYLRKWDGKDLDDLKGLIDLTLHWMEAEALTKKVLTDMPPSGKARPQQAASPEPGIDC